MDPDHELITTYYNLLQLQQHKLLQIITTTATQIITTNYNLLHPITNQLQTNYKPITHQLQTNFKPTTATQIIANYCY